MAIAYLTHDSLDKVELVPAVAGKRIRILRIMAASNLARWVIFTSATSVVDPGTALFGDLYLSSLLTSTVPFDEKYAVTSNVGEGIYIEFSAAGGKTDLTVWYDLVPA